MVIFFFFKQNTAYEMRISDWSSDVCSSDLLVIEVMPKSVWMDLCECRIHCTHSSEDLAIERRDRQRLAPSKALVMRDEQVRVSPGGSDLDADRKSTRLNSSQ